MSQKTYDDQWTHKGCIIRQRGSAYQVESNYNRKRQRKTFDTLAKAKAYAGKKATEIHNLGVAALTCPVVTGRMRWRPCG